MSAQPAGREAIEACLGRILQRSDFPALAEHIQELVEQVADESGSIRQVTNVILKDAGLALRIIRTANSPAYNRSGRPILTVAHAVSLIGLEAIRDLAVSLLLFKHYQTRAPGIRQLMLLSLLTANHAREAAAHARYPRCEEAYLCGMFRNLGEVLVACYLPPEYAAILLEMKRRHSTERVAAQKILGFTYDELGRTAAERWRMPDKVGRTMASEGRPPAPRSEIDLLKALTAFGHDLTDVLHRGEPESVPARMNLLLQTYGPALGMRREDILKISAGALAETKATFDNLRIPLDELRLRKQTEEALARAEAAVEAATSDALPELETGAPDERLLERLVLEVEAAVDAGEFELTGVLMMVLEALLRGAGFDRVVFCLVAEDRRSMQARLGLGENIESLIARFRFPLSRRASPLAASLLERRDLFVSDGRFDGGDLTPLVEARCFGIYPVFVDDVLAGCLYFDRREAAALEPGVVQQLGRLRDLAGQAIARKR